MFDNYFLLFTLDCYRTDSLIAGRLLLMNGPHIVERFIATSGLPGFQFSGSYSLTARGPIPRPDIAGLPYYTVTTSADYVTAEEQPGIAGNFYAVTPDEVHLNGVTRGLFGIHRDANVPGTNGCVGLLTASGWDAFQEHMLKLHDAGVKSLPLQVDYSL
jgi:hypothetical protein